MSVPDPDWSLLPAHPREFFGLEEGFDERGLKRAYSHLIRHFKPERFPAEFQRIREAYERLRDELTFGATIANSPASETGFHAPDDPAQAEAAPEAPRRDLSALLRETTPAGFRDMLRALPDKTAHEWGILAVVEDELAPDDPLRLFEVLGDALEATEGGLMGMLYEACREPIALQDSLHLVQRLARLVERGLDPSWYYYLTAPLWLELVRKAPFAKVAEALEQCRRRVGPEGFQGYVTLLIGLVRAGAYRADDRWIESSIQAIAEVYAELPDHLQYRVDVFDFLDRYRQDRGSFPEGSPLGREIDRVLELIATGEEVEADRAFLQLMIRIVDEPEELRQCLPEWNEAVGTAYRILSWYSSEVDERRGVEDQELEHWEARKIVREFMQRIEKRTDRSFMGLLWNLIALLAVILTITLVIGSIGVAFVANVQFLLHSESLLLFTLGVALIIGLVALGAWVWRREAYYGWVLGRLNSFFASWIYRRQWRPALIEFFQESRISYGTLTELLPEVDSDKLTNVDPLAQCLDADPSMAIHSIALRSAE